MRYHQLLVEKILNLHTSEEKMKYADKIWDMLQRSYKKMGGFKSANSPEELANDPGYWKLVRRGSHITALGVYKKVPNTNNFKMIASATETEPDTEGAYKATEQGKKDYHMLKNDDIKTKRAWTEVSGPAEKLMLKAGAKPIDNKYAEFLTGKKILDLNNDGYHYTRLIQGEPHEKIIVGFVHLSLQGKEKLIKLGFDLKHLPDNIASEI
jgi:hypothetical protein